MLASIETRFAGPTDTRSSRIIATDANGGRAVWRCQDSKNVQDQHRDAALALLAKRGWGGVWAEGGGKNGGHVFVCVARQRDEQPAVIVDGFTDPREVVALLER